MHRRICVFKNIRVHVDIAIETYVCRDAVRVIFYLYTKVNCTFSPPDGAVEVLVSEQS